MTVYGIHKDFTDELMANAMYPEQIVEDSYRWMENQVLDALRASDEVLSSVDTVGESYVRLERKRWRHVVGPFDYEDEDGVTHHSEGYECTRIEVIGYKLEEDQ